MVCVLAIEAIGARVGAIEEAPPSETDPNVDRAAVPVSATIARPVFRSWNPAVALTYWSIPCGSAACPVSGAPREETTW